jgi:hypothetical protein
MFFVESIIILYVISDILPFELPRICVSNSVLVVPNNAEFLKKAVARC